MQPVGAGQGMGNVPGGYRRYPISTKWGILQGILRGNAGCYKRFSCLGSIARGAGSW